MHKYKILEKEQTNKNKALHWFCLFLFLFIPLPSWVCSQGGWDSVTLLFMCTERLGYPVGFKVGKSRGIELHLYPWGIWYWFPLVQTVAVAGPQCWLLLCGVGTARVQARRVQAGACHRLPEPSGGAVSAPVFTTFVLFSYWDFVKNLANKECSHERPLLACHNILNSY